MSGKIKIVICPECHGEKFYELYPEVIAACRKCEGLGIIAKPTGGEETE